MWFTGRAAPSGFVAVRQGLVGDFLRVRELLFSKFPSLSKCLTHSIRERTFPRRKQLSLFSPLRKAKPRIGIEEIHDAPVHGLCVPDSSANKTPGLGNSLLPDRSVSEPWANASDE